MKKYDRIINCFLAAIIIITVGLIAFVNLFHYNYKMNADIASEAMLARLIWESGEWVPGSWYPSTELRFLGTPNLASLFYGIFADMSWAMGVACTAMTIVILLSGYFFVSQFSYSRSQKLAFLLSCLMIPNQFATLELFYLFAGYYAIHVIVTFFTLGVYARLISVKPVNWFLLIVTVILSFVMGIQGVRGILILSGPLLVTELIRQLYSVYAHKQRTQRDPVTSGWCFLLLIAGYAGTRMPFSVAQEGISRNVRKGFVKLWEKVFQDVLVCLGWTQTGLLGRVLLLLLLAAGVFGLAYYMKQMLTKQDLDNDAWIYLMLWCSPIITMLLAAFTTANSAERYYFMLLFALAFGFVGLLKRVDKNVLILRCCGYTVILLLFVVQLSTVYLPIMKSEEPPRTKADEVSRYLEESGYDMAYATFEHANTMTVLSGGAVRVAAVASVEKMDVCKWLSSTDWYVPNVPYESPTAYIVTESEKESFEKFLELHQGDIEFDVQIGIYLIYVSGYNFSCLE